MHNQPKFIPLRSSEFYSDRRSARYPVPGTVPQLDDKQLDQAQLDPGSYFLTGRHGKIERRYWPADRSATTSTALRAIPWWVMETE
jgi:hypothetical protein